MADLIRIVDWDQLYENNRTRGLKRLDWVPVPNRMDGDGYTELLDHINGASHYGAWMALLLIASKCEVRGVLMRKSSNTPHTAASLSRISRIPVEVFHEVLPRLKYLGWISLEAVEDKPVVTIPHPSAGIPHDDASSRTRAHTSVPFPSIPFSSGESEGEIPKEENPAWIVEQVCELYGKAGIPPTEAVKETAVRILLGKPPGQRIWLLEYVQWAFENRWRDASTTMELENLLRSGKWCVKLGPRTLPDARAAPKKSRAEQLMDQI